MSHLKQAKEIMARLNANRQKDPSVYHEKKRLVDAKDDTIKERVTKNELTEVDRFQILHNMKKVYQEKNKRDAETRQKNLKVKTGKVSKEKKKKKGKDKMKVQQK